MAVECVHIHMLQVAQNIDHFCCIFENFPMKRMDLCISKCPADVVTNKDWKIKAFLLDNKSHSLRFQTNSPRRTIHHIRAESCSVCSKLCICAVIFNAVNPSTSAVHQLRLPTAAILTQISELGTRKPGTQNLELETWNLEPRTWNLEPRTWNLEPGTWNLEPGTRNLAQDNISWV